MIDPSTRESPEEYRIVALRGTPQWSKRISTTGFVGRAVSCVSSKNTGRRVQISSPCMAIGRPFFHSDKNTSMRDVGSDSRSDSSPEDVGSAAGGPGAADGADAGVAEG